MHRNLVNGKIYIGKTNNISRRWRSNGIEYKPYSDKEHTRPFWNAIKKYGWDSFEHIVLEDGLTDEESSRREIYYISKYQSNDTTKGYNLAPGGNGGRIYSIHPKGMTGKKHSDKWKAAHSEWASDHANNCMNNGQVIWGVTHEHPKGFRGHRHSEDEKRRIRETLLTNKSRASIKKVCVQYPDGSQRNFESVGDMQKALGISSTIFARIRRNGMIYTVVPTSRHFFPELDGCKFVFV